MNTKFQTTVFEPSLSEVEQIVETLTKRFRDCCLLGFVRLQFFSIGGSFLGGV